VTPWMSPRELIARTALIGVSLVVVVVLLALGGP
jgi:hypothetical protein